MSGRETATKGLVTQGKQSQAFAWETVCLVSAIASKPKRNIVILAARAANQNAAAGSGLNCGWVRINARSCFSQSV